MCGRYTLIDLQQTMRGLGIHFSIGIKSLVPQYNIAPSQQVPVILNTTPEELTMARWGLVPHWATDPKIGYKMINARAETITEKPTFKRLFQTQRCLLLADGFYEWQRAGRVKIPHHITLKDGSPFAFAGLWDAWDDPGTKSTLVSCTIITTSASSLIKPIHDRMPVILKFSNGAAWLDPQLDAEKAHAMLKPYTASEMKAVEISTLVNSPGNNVPEVIKPVGRPVLKRRS